MKEAHVKTILVILIFIAGVIMLNPKIEKNNMHDIIGEYTFEEAMDFEYLGQPFLWDCETSVQEGDENKIVFHKGYTVIWIKREVTNE